jgi:succinate-acetate transporter protein
MKQRPRLAHLYARASRASEEDNEMTTQDDRSLRTVHAETEPEAMEAAWVGGPGHAFPATATGVPLSAFAFAFAVGVLGLVDTGILPSAASGMFIATALGIGAGGLLVGGLWEFRGGELFGGTFGVGYAGFLLSTGLILKFFAGPIATAAGPVGFDHTFAAWLILWAIFTAILAVGAWHINMAAFVPFLLAGVVLVLEAVGFLGGAAGWASGISKVGGWVALADSAAAGYLASAILLNSTIGKDLLPLGPYRAA